MLIGLTLLAVGVTLLGYVVTAGQSTPTPSEQTGDIPPATDSQDPLGTAKTLLMRVRSAPGNAPLTALPDPQRPAKPSREFPAPRWDPRVVVAYEDEAQETESRSPEARILVSASGDTDRGRRRRGNDDSLLLLPDHGLFAVADGMGGYAGGSIASGLAVEALQQTFEQAAFRAELRADGPVPLPGNELASAIMQAHQAVFRAARASHEHCKMGTTLVAARFSPNQQRVYIGHVGDSRCYRLRRGTLRQLTTDQTLRKLGLDGPHGDELLQAVGVSVDLSIDLIVDKPQGGDLYLLCSDGLNKMVKDQQIRETLVQQRDPEAAVYGLIELANDAGGRDNVTVILIKVLDRSLHDLVTVPSPPPDPAEPEPEPEPSAFNARS